MDKLKEIAKRAVEDYGFRQIAQWSPDDLVEQWDLSPTEAQVLKGALKDEIDQLPVPVEPTDYEAVEGRLNSLIQNALG
jgi:hypothetical protein